MKKEIIDGYEIFIENGDLKQMRFKNYCGENICVVLDENLKIEFLKRRREYYSEEHEIRAHIDKYLTDEYLMEIKKESKISSSEKIFFERYNMEIIIQEILKLPTPQNRRVYMKLINELSLTKIAEIEKRSIPTIKESIDRGISALRRKLKNFF